MARKAKNQYEGIDAEPMESERPTAKLRRKPEAMFLNKKDALGRAYSIELKNVKLNPEQVKQIQIEGKLLGFTPEFKYDNDLNKDVFLGGIGKVPKDYEVKGVKPVSVLPNV